MDKPNRLEWITATKQYGNFMQQWTVLQINAQGVEQYKKVAEGLKQQYEKNKKELETCDLNVRDIIQESANSFKDLYQKAQIRYETDKASVVVNAQDLQRSIAQYQTTAPHDLVSGISSILQNIETFCRQTTDSI